MNEETELKYKVGDVVLVKVRIVGVDPDDAENPYEVECCEWPLLSEIFEFTPKEEA